MNKRLRHIEEYVREHGIKIRFVDTGRLYGYDGMNPEAAKAMGFPRIPKRTIIVDKRMRGSTKCRTILHEIEEMLLMERRGYTYWRAHKIAFRRETEAVERIRF